jgi:ketohexokinase
MARVLGIGIATLDIINSVDGYPAEDAEVRALNQQLRRGGNCANTLVVLQQLGHHCAWGGVLAAEADARPVRQDLERHCIDLGATRIIDHGKIPTSYITLNRRNGSRTIVHYRDLPEFGYADFARIDLRGYDWLHFEGRNVAETRRMLGLAEETVPGTPRSVEIEKPRPDIERLFPLAHILLFSRHFALAHGYEEPRRFLEAIAAETPAVPRFLAWGEAGAYGLDHDGRLCHSPAYPPPQMVDTIGAGDVFNAGIIDALLRGVAPQKALHQACRLAGGKCGREGLGGIAPLTRELP